MGEENLTRRERQIMAALYRRRCATAAEIKAALTGTPSYSTVRTQLRVLERKGHVRHEVGSTFLYSPVISLQRARRAALRHVVEAFFDGSVDRAISALRRMRSVSG